MKVAVEARKGIRSSGAAVTGDSEPRDVNGRNESGTPGKQQVSLTAEPSLRPLNRLLDVLCGRQGSWDLNMAACVLQGSRVRNLILHYGNTER